MASSQWPKSRKSTAKNVGTQFIAPFEWPCFTGWIEESQWPEFGERAGGSNRYTQDVSTNGMRKRQNDQVVFDG